MTTSFVVYLMLGGLLIWTIRKFPLSGWLSKKSAFFYQLFDCQFCLGFWVYLLLEIVFPIEIEFIPNIPLVSHFFIALGTSFVAWLLVAGWNTYFKITVVE